MLTIRLMGAPGLARDGQPIRSPRGRKSWALLAHLLLSRRAPSRQHLAELLFSDADDPLGALRWTLAELRRALGDSTLLRGDPLGLEFGDEVTVDVELLSTSGDDPPALLALGDDLLEGIDLSSSPSFESWLAAERHRLSATAEARLRQNAIALLATGRARDAVPYARAAVDRNPLDEGNHELLVRCLTVSGDRAAALRQVAICEDILQRELGIGASASLREAAQAGATGALVPALSGRAASISQLEAGQAAIAAGAVEAGVATLRRAVAEAATVRDDALHGRTLAALGSALVHSMRGRDEEGSVVLHEAIRLATRAGDRATSVTALRTLGFVDVQAGRGVTGDAWLARAAALAETDEERAAVLGVRGMSASDRGDYAGAFEYLSQSAELAQSAADQRQQAWSLSLVGRAHILRGEHHQAELAVQQSLDLVRQQRWMAFLPWPQALQAELDLTAGAVDRAADGFERAWTLGCQLGDPCWEGMAARGLGLINVSRGDQDAATTWLTEAAARVNRVVDRYQWMHAHVVDTMITAALDRGETDGVQQMAGGLAALAARCDMRELVVRARVHQARLGDPVALAAARLLVADIDNQVLTGLVQAAAGTGSGTTAGASPTTGQRSRA